jgi:hypothetical protein
MGSEIRIFEVQGALFKQVQGVTIGSPLAPVLCSLAISDAELRRLANDMNSDKIIPIRYVDNILGMSEDVNWNGWSEEIYMSPISLEHVIESNKFLGVIFELKDNKFHTIYDTSEEQWRYVSVSSAGSVARRISGFISRAHLACKHSFPFHKKQKAIISLMAQYKLQGVSFKQLCESIKSLKVITQKDKFDEVCSFFFKAWTMYWTMCESHDKEGDLGLVFGFVSCDLCLCRGGLIRL